MVQLKLCWSITANEPENARFSPLPNSPNPVLSQVPPPYLLEHLSEALFPEVS